MQAPPSLPYESKVILGHRSQNQLLWSRNRELHRGQKPPQELTTHPSLLCNAMCAQRENSFQNYPVLKYLTPEGLDLIALQECL